MELVLLALLGVVIAGVWRFARRMMFLRHLRRHGPAKVQKHHEANPTGLREQRQPGAAPEPPQRRRIERVRPPPLRLVAGRVLFRVPRRMWKQVPERVELRLTPRQVLDEDARRQLLASFRHRGGRIEEMTVDRIGSRMAAELLGDTEFFAIAPLSSTEQDLDLDGEHALRWDWEVSPLRTGRGALRIRLTVMKDAAGQVFQVDAAPFERIVEVRIRSMGTELRRFWRDHWKWVLTTSGGLGAAATLYGWMAGLFTAGP